jgi:hypothetical protein
VHPNLGEKKRKSQPRNNTLKEEKKKKKGTRNPTCTFSLSLSFLFRELNAQCARLLVSLFCASLLFALFSSERRKERIKRAFKVKDKKILWCA